MTARRADINLPKKRKEKFPQNDTELLTRGNSRAWQRERDCRDALKFPSSNSLRLLGIYVCDNLLFLPPRRESETKLVCLYEQLETKIKSQRFDDVDFDSVERISTRFAVMK